MTKTVGERMAVIETEIVNIKEGLEKTQKEQSKGFDEIITKLDNMDKKFAAKWVEKVTLGVLISVLAGIALLVLR